jgi:DNA repair photolyase
MLGGEGDIARHQAERAAEESNQHRRPFAAQPPAIVDMRQGPGQKTDFLNQLAVKCLFEIFTRIAASARKIPFAAKLAEQQNPGVAHDQRFHPAGFRNDRGNFNIWCGVDQFQHDLAVTAVCDPLESNEKISSSDDQRVNYRLNVPKMFYMRVMAYRKELLMVQPLPKALPAQPPRPGAQWRGRGAVSNALSLRFQSLERAPAAPELEDDETELPRRPTEVRIERPRTILTRNQSPDIPFDRSVNAYRGCEHGCTYCYARPTHAWLDLSPGLDFETILTAKPDAARLLEAELMKPGYAPEPIAMGTNTDPYQPIESQFRITRSILQLLDRLGHPCTITTKSARVLDDAPLLEKLAARNLVSVNISITTLDPALARAMEPRASTPSRRLESIRQLAARGVPVTIFVSPVIPGLNDAEIEMILARAKEAGARGASSIMLRLPHEVSPLFRAWLERHYPDRAAKVMAQVQAMRDGKDNDPRFGTRMRGQGVFADMIRARFTLACRKLGLDRSPASLSVDHFRGHQPAQGDLFLTAVH